MDTSNCFKLRMGSQPTKQETHYTSSYVQVCERITGPKEIPTCGMATAALHDQPCVRPDKKTSGHFRSGVRVHSAYEGNEPNRVRPTL